jgi:glycosyltransferase involved in cell wall biosynthesis
MNKPHISVITPTFNRAHTLDRVYSSLASQTFKSFEWIVIDDGSTDETKALIENYSRTAFFPIKYYYKKNGGKHRAMNIGFSRAQGELVLVFDSDDWCFPYALERLFELWRSLPDCEKGAYSGVSVLKTSTAGKVIGDKYPEYPPLNNYIDRYNRRIKGDKWELIRRDICIDYPYPEIEGEKYIAPSYPWLQIGKKYKTIFSNEALFFGDYLNDGISNNNILFRAKSPKGCCKVYDLQHQVSDNLRTKIKSAINYYRFFWRCGAKKRFGKFTVPGLICGFFFYVFDNCCIKKRKLLSQRLH